MRDRVIENEERIKRIHRIFDPGSLYFARERQQIYKDQNGFADKAEVKHQRCEI